MKHVQEIVDHIQPTSPIYAIISLVLNIFLPGWGTILNGIMGPTIDAIEIVIGVIQLFTAFCIIGWIWSMVWGVLIFLKKKEPAAASADKEGPTKH